MTTDIPLQSTSEDIWRAKFQLKDKDGNPVNDEHHFYDTFRRVAKALASSEKDKDHWFKEFYTTMINGATPAGRILSNAGAGEHKPKTSLINCTVSNTVEDSMEGIMRAATNSAITLASGAGIGYEFSTLRPKGAFVRGAGSYTSGPLTFMDIFDTMCFTVSSAGGRRGAQMGTMAVWHPDIESFIKAKREDGRFRQFNLSLLIDDEFIAAVKNDLEWDLFFPVMKNERCSTSKFVRKSIFWDKDYCERMGYWIEDDKLVCKVYNTIKAKELWETIMMSTYNFAEPGFLLIDNINKYNNNYFCENIRATNPCGEQPLPPDGSCLLGSINLVHFVSFPFKENATFDFASFKENVRTFCRMLDNVVEMNGLPLTEQQNEIKNKRRHGMGFTGLGSTFSLLGITYGSEESIQLTEQISKTMALVGYEEGIKLAIEKGPAPILESIQNREKWVESEYMKRIWEIWPEGKNLALTHGCRYTHHSSIAPTGTISLSVGNNVSNGIEPSFSHKYTRNVIVPGKKTKEAVSVYSYEMLLYKHVFKEDDVPSFFSTSDSVTPIQHIKIQAAAQKWTDSSISKTINVPTDTPFDEFQNIYMEAYNHGLKGCTTFRFNPEAFQGVLVKEDDLKSTKYTFRLEDGSTVEVNGSDEIEYDGEIHSAANLADAIKEGLYGKF
jgi:ribonucleoside-diphosphate reductase alpha chain